ncbi:malonate decarboxylase holo-ACP synthase [Nocardia jiangxiensis]|uniref:Malonate decarboxylase holo-ACP synthase n=1 Tax=Nocardia jiangxiensis TaxID=282685 RepID=A0ABW6SBU9_9NOCA
MASVMRPHDLLRLDVTAVPDQVPDWVERGLGALPWVVVRRASAPPGRIAVGVRGRRRAERFATVVGVDTVTEVLTPQALRHRIAPTPHLPACRALRAARRTLDGLGLPWGPTGSVAFALATGAPVVTQDSDLDLVLRADAIPDAGTLTAIHEALSRLPAPVDCQIEIPSGAVALAELLAGDDRLLLRTSSGPRLVSRPELRKARA